MKILSIGNSFSQDAHKWLHKLAKQNGTELECVNLYIGGCSLERHWNNYIENKADYMLERNSVAEKKVSLPETLTNDKYDIVTLQQFSGLSGRPQSYYPYIFRLAEEVRENQPDAKLYFHQTWSYEKNSKHASFADYNNDQWEMHRRISDAAETAAKLIGAEIIPSGDFIQKLRETLPEFDYGNGGISLSRDGFHLSLDYGRYAAAALWFYILTGKKPKSLPFEDFDTELLKKIILTLD